MIKMPKTVRLERVLVVAILFSGLVVGSWQGLHKWGELQRSKPTKTIVIKSPSRTPAQKAEATRQRTRRSVKSDRSNIDCAVMKCIALTYDDGPSAHTNDLMDTLKAKKAKATFFVLGTEAAKHPDVLKRMVREGHEIGNHTWNHPRLTQISNPEVSVQILQADNLIKTITGRTPRLVRPPYGAYDASVTQLAIRPLAMWSIDPKDWRFRNPDMAYEHVVAHAHPGGVVVLHDIHAPSVQATPRVIDELQRQGYVLVTMSEMFGVTDKNLPAFSQKVLKKR